MSESVWIIEFRRRSSAGYWYVWTGIFESLGEASAVANCRSRHSDEHEYRAVEYVRKEEPKP
jgi:hypothetical protein